MDDVEKKIMVGVRTSSQLFQQKYFLLPSTWENHFFGKTIVKP
jgi:hypothetical protein